MFCMKCDAKLLDGAVFCTNCGTIVQSKVQKVKSPLYKPEKAIRQGLCNRIKNKTNVENGKAVLTNHRFAYLKLGFSRTFAMIFLNNLTTGDLYIPLTEIRSIKNGLLGSSKTVVIYTKAGEKFDFYFENRDEWKNSIQKAVMAMNR